MLVDTTYRSKQDEILDDFDLQGPELETSLEDIARVNRWLGGNYVTLSGIRELLKDQKEHKKFTVVDIGCGNGDMLREIAQYAEKSGLHIKLIGIDANSNTIAQARVLSKKYNSIHYEVIDIFSKEFESYQYDIGLCTLTLHHFDNEQIIKMLEIFAKQSKVGFIINDLHRSRVAYYLFKIVSTIFIKSKVAKHDGLISILRGFKRIELSKWSKRLNLNSSIRWRWAFRYQWIIRTQQGLQYLKQD